MKNKIIIEGVMTFSFSYTIDTESSIEALDEARRRVNLMNSTNPTIGYGEFEETPKIVYHVKEMKEEKDND